MTPALACCTDAHVFSLCSNVQRFIGQRYEDEGVSQDISRLTYTVAASEPNAQGGGKGTPLIKIDMGMVSGTMTLFASRSISIFG